MVTIFITAAILFFCGAVAVILFIWWLIGFSERKEEKTIYENTLEESNRRFQPKREKLNVSDSN